MEDCTVHCESYYCIHNKGTGVYGICHNDAVNKYYDSVGIDRVYMHTCKLCQLKDKDSKE